MMDIKVPDIVESDKASMEISSSHARLVIELTTKLGDQVKQGSVVMVLYGEGASACPAPAAILASDVLAAVPWFLYPW
jgi:pyruvate/2-oxoglutarate dehydrogenase complex dihydrolipoamide acyltransferase (E2) component